MSNDLFLQVDPGDTGVRPYKQCQDFWKNQSIWMEGVDQVNNPTPDQTTTQVGLPTKVRVRVRTMGNQKVPFVKVQAWVLDPQVGIAHPGQAIETMSSFGPNAVQDVDPGINGAVFDCGPWTPTQSQLSGSVGGHLCLAANAYQDPNLADPPLDGKQLQAADTFDMCNNAHQGQRNILLSPAKQGVAPPQVAFVVHPPPGQQPATVSVTKLLSTQALHPNERFLLNSHRDIGFRRVNGRNKLFITLPDGRLERLGFSRFKPHFNLHLPQFGIGRAVRVDGLASQTSATLDLGLTGEEPVGHVHAFDIVQHTADGRQIGSGLRVLTVVTP